MKLDTVIAERKTKTIYRDGDLCIKVFNSTFSKADILNEALHNARVEDVGLYVPKILEVTTIDGKWAIVSEFIEGTTLSHLMRDNPEKKDEYLDLLVETQMQIHSKHSPLLSRLKDKMNRKILSADLEPVTRYELLIRLEGLPTHDKLCHGDLCPSNIILTPEGELYIIDWAHATQGNASADVARTYLTFHLRGEADGIATGTEFVTEVAHARRGNRNLVGRHRVFGRNQREGVENVAFAFLEERAFLAVDDDAHVLFVLAQAEAFVHHQRGVAATAM